ncbi:MAG: cysteine--tRNA ligase [Chloroflexi bacterium]|nr:cysteine--tRNA ligase [Chloroflexota bacterium]
MTGVRLYDSATRTVRPFEPLVAGRVGIYDCGPTVYSYQHIGNLYRYIVADVVRRTFEYCGYKVTQVMNITDVGHLFDDADQGTDKMEQAAKREGRDPAAIAKHYTDHFLADRAKLNVLPPHVMPYATEHVPEMIEAVKTLIAKGHAYPAADGVYFDITTFPGYGARLNPPGSFAERQAGARVEVNDAKRHPYDFALWRAAKPGDLQQWDSPWGRGNPGWHIECSVMSMKYLGETFDLHSGGEDHLFPHHECEIAQSEAATGKLFVRNWMHTYFLSVDGGAMHKSKGNVYLVSDFAAHGCEPLAFRMLALGVGYRKSLDFTWRALQDAQRRLDRWRSAIGGAWQRLQGSTGAVDPADPVKAAFAEAITDDFNTPRALAQAEAALDLVNGSDGALRARGLAILFDMDQVLGLGLRASAEATVLLGDVERALLDERAAARAAKDFARSDALRAQLQAKGILVKDTSEGQRWERVSRVSEGEPA